MKIDARIPVRFGPAASLGPNETLYVASGTTHAPGCACCMTRTAAGMALAALFQARATGAVGWFATVLVEERHRLAVADALRTDPVAAARFR